MNNKMSSYLEMIEKSLEQYVPKPEENNLRAKVYNAVRYSLLDSGKRIRPIFTLAFAEICGGTPEDALPFACAIEMIHTYSLIHDDLPAMDNDIMRRGKNTNHIEFGEDIAILAGDALLTMAFEAALSHKDTEKAVKAGQVLAKLSGIDGMVGGQCIDLESEGKDVNLEVVEEMYIGKTVALISAACQMGCISAGEYEMQKVAEKYAEKLGLAFQIRDDILGISGDEEEIGKTVGLDIENKKSSYVSIVGLRESQKYVDEYTGEAVSLLNDFSGDKAFLMSLTEKLANRIK